MAETKSKKRPVAILAGICLSILLVWALFYVYQNWTTKFSGSNSGYHYRVEYRDIPLDTIDSIEIVNNYIEIRGTRITIKDWVREWNPDSAVVRLKRRDNYQPLKDVNDKWKIRGSQKINPSDSVYIFYDVQRNKEISITLPDKLLGVRKIFQVNEELTLFYFAGGAWKGGPDPGCCTGLVAIYRPPNQAFNPDPAASRRRAL